MNQLAESLIYYTKVFGIVLSSTACVTIIWEHIARKYKSEIKPSVYLNFASEKSISFFKKCGELLAWVSSYLARIDLKDFGETLMAVGKPTFDLVSSPAYTVYGYVKHASTYANKQGLIYAGSAVGVCIIAFGWSKFVSVYPQCDLFGVTSFVTNNVSKLFHPMPKN
jgi:hypothetical protein